MTNSDQSYLKKFIEEKSKKYHLTKEKLQKMIVSVNEGIEKQFYTDSKDLKHIEKIRTYISMILNKKSNREINISRLLQVCLYSNMETIVKFLRKIYAEVSFNEQIKKKFNILSSVVNLDSRLLNYSAFGAGDTLG